MSSCPDLKRFLKPLGNKRQIFWTPILQLAEICHSYYDAHTGLPVGNKKANILDSYPATSEKCHSYYDAHTGLPVGNKCVSQAASNACIQFTLR